MKILNSKGQPIKLANQVEKIIAYNQRKANDLGYNVNLTALTQVISRVSEQKFYTIPIADYLPVKVGNGAWLQQLLTYREYSSGDGFETGIINTGTNNGRMASVNTGVDPILNKILNWGKTIGWSLFDLQIASKAGNWDIVEAMERARKKNWDLGIQNVAFLGLPGDASVRGLLNQAGITTDTTFIGSTLGSMDAATYSAFVQGIMGKYRTASSFTAWANRLIVPEYDFLALAGPASATYPGVTKLQLLEDAMKKVTQRDFKVLPLAYASGAVSGAAYDEYVLYNYDEESIRMDIPVDYNATLASTLDNFSFQNVGYGQFTGVLAYRPAEMMYFRRTLP